MRIEREEGESTHFGQVISDAKLIKSGRHECNGALVLKFESGGQAEVFDAGGDCCENRYLTCDDDLSALIGGKLLSVECEAATSVDDEHGEPHEQMFVKVSTDKAVITLCTHNEHDGYYGGFDVKMVYKEERGSP